MNRRSLLMAGLGVAALPLIPELASAGAWKWADTRSGKPFSKDPSVIRFEDRYLMYYSTPPTATEPLWGQAVASSTDLNRWRSEGVIARGFCAADAIVLGGRVHLFVQSYGQNQVDSIATRAPTTGSGST